MNFSCIFLLALALFGAATQAYIAPVYPGVEGIGGVGGVGYNGICGTTCGTGYGAGYGVGLGAGYEGGYGCRTACATACAPAAVCDTCQCVKTVVRPVVERIPYSCQRRVQAPACRTACGVYAGGVYGNAGAGYMNGGYVY